VDTLAKSGRILRDRQEEVRSWRHDIHRHPELGFQENRTAGKVAGLLTEFGLDVHTGIGGTGVVGVLKRGAGDQAIDFRTSFRPRRGVSWLWSRWAHGNVTCRR
jgi:hippurate hydrolase